MYVTSHRGQFSLAMGRCNEFQRNVGRKQAYRAMH